MSSTFISVTIIDDAQMRRLNRKHKKKDYPTDVLSFNMNEKLQNGTFYLGDIAVNADQARRQAKEYNNDFEHEISDLVAHGVLHLLGIHHEDDE